MKTLLFVISLLVPSFTIGQVVAVINVDGVQHTCNITENITYADLVITVTCTDVIQRNGFE